jgi:hypothetical protein
LNRTGNNFQNTLGTADGTTHDGSNGYPLALMRLSGVAGEDTTMGMSKEIRPAPDTDDGEGATLGVVKWVYAALGTDEGECEGANMGIAKGVEVSMGAYHDAALGTDDGEGITPGAAEGAEAAMGTGNGITLLLGASATLGVAFGGSITRCGQTSTSRSGKARPSPVSP